MTCGCSEGLMFGGAYKASQGKDSTKAELYAKAVAMDIKGRSKMTKDELKKACSRKSKK